MKKLLLSISALVILGLPTLSAQLINSGFETWSKNLLVPSANDPNTGIGSTGWWDLNALNSLFLGSSPITVYKDSLHPFQGKYCAKIVSQTMTTKSYDTIKHFDPGFNYPQTNGLIFAGTISGSFKVTTGIPVNTNWSSFSFFYKYYPNGGDTGSCTVAIYHWDATAKQRILIGGGIWKTSATESTWSPATVAIAYDTALSADTAFVLFSAASLYSNPKVNDSMMIDSSSILGIGSIATHHDNVTLYPNPAQNEVNLAITGQFQAAKVEVYDVTGKAIGTYSINNNSMTINTQAYPNGLYIYRLLDNAGVQLNVGKFSVVK